MLDRKLRPAIGIVGTVFETEFGWVGLAGSAAGIRRTTLPKPNRQDCWLEIGDGVGEVADDSAFGDLVVRFQRYFQGEPVSFPDVLDFGVSSPFLRAVWEETRSIPYGETRSYGWLAGKVGRPGAARAVGRAMATNPVPIIVPCHRVIGSDGSLHGFGGGLPLKERMLGLEGAKW